MITYKTAVQGCSVRMGFFYIFHKFLRKKYMLESCDEVISKYKFSSQNVIS